MKDVFMKPEMLSAICALISVIVSIVAIVISIKISREQGILVTRLDEKELSTENKRFFATILWEQISKISYINPQDIVWPDVIRAINTMEITAMCWNKGIADKDMIVISFGQLYDELCTQISKIEERHPDININGDALLKRNPLILDLRAEINRANVEMVKNINMEAAK